MFLRHTLPTVVFLMLLVPAAAGAEGLVIPFFGVNFGGDSGKDFGDAVDAKRYNWGVSLAVMGGGVVGIEADIGYSPDFYGKSDLGGSSTFTAMGNLLLAVPLGGRSGFGFRPYALGGLGMIRSTVESFGDPLKVDENQFGWDFGGGVMLFFNDHTGLRGELRYFRTFSDVDFLGIDIGDKPGAVDFTRGSVGFIFRF